MNTKILSSGLLIAILFSSNPSHAVLVNNFDGTITDTSTNLMWLQDLNWTDTYGIDDGLYGEDKNGALLWSDAVNWADNLNFLGYDDWRLATADASCINHSNIDALQYNCTGSELGHLYYNCLGNVAGGIGGVDLGPFTNSPTYLQFWTSTEYNADHAFDFHLNDGSQHAYEKDNPGGTSGFFFDFGSYTNVIAVRDLSTASNNSGQVPAPSVFLLLLTGATGLLIFNRKKV